MSKLYRKARGHFNSFKIPKWKKEEAMQYGKFDRGRLPSPATYYKQQGLKFKDTLEWQSVLCPFHDDKHPSLMLRLDRGGFCCMACNVFGGDILDFHMQRYNLRFAGAVKELCDEEVQS